jgi:glycosyltransferase involved in cell wall biosynthesis
MLSRNRPLSRMGLRKKFFILISKPYLGHKRSQFAQLLATICLSKKVRLAMVWLHLRRGEPVQASSPYFTSLELARLVQELRTLQDDPILIQSFLKARSEYGLPLFACLYWQESLKLQALWPLPLRQAAFQAWWENHGPTHHVNADRLLEQSSATHFDQPRFRDGSFGVNLVGHAFNVFGLGEYIRMMARALEAAGIPFCIDNIPSGNGASDQDRCFESKVLPADQPLPYAFTLFCTTADVQLDLAMRLALVPGPQSYYISCWFWEMEHWPERLRPTLHLAHEFWPCTRLIETALRSADQPQPVKRIPPVVDLSAILATPDLCASREEARDWFGLDPTAILFVFSFDLNSRITRKNPQAVLQAFQRAFGAGCPSEHADSGVGLVIKCFPPLNHQPLWDDLKATAAADPRITIIEANLDRPKLLALYGCCDAFVSLHRSEGLGLGMAEALQLGLDVIATSYGGNSDFLAGPLAHPISYQLVPVRDEEYPHHEGLVWADPDVDQAADRMRDIVTARRANPRPDPAVIQAYRDQFSAARIGALYRLRLEELWARRDEIQAEMETDRCNA